jgi:hypothetical protein
VTETPNPEPRNLQANDATGDINKTKIHVLQQELASLQQQNASLTQRLESLEGAAIAAFENKITDLDAGQGNQIFANYHSVLVNNFTDSVIKKLFDSGDFGSQMMQTLWQNLRNWRGVISLIGISGLGAIGVLTLINQMNNYVLSKADQVFEKQIDAKAPAMLERLERDRETIMLLTLDISAQDQVNQPILGVADLGIDPVREAYLENNVDYEKILVDFLRGDSNSPLQTKIVRANSRNKAILRYYALNYILQVNPDNDFKEALLAVLKDENIELKDEDAGTDSATGFINRLDARNQILAIRALRRYKNQMNRLAKEVLLHDDYEYLYKNSTFWRGFLNELIFTPLEKPFDGDVIQTLLASDWLKDGENRREIASPMLMLFTLYPDLCGDDCREQIDPLVATIQDSLQQQDDGNPIKAGGVAGDFMTNTGGITSAPVDDSFNCPRYLTAANMADLLSYRQGRTTPVNLETLTEVLGAFDCVLGLYHQNWRNFAFYQDPVLFYGDTNAAAQPGISALLHDYVNLHWEGVERGYLRVTEEAPQLSWDNALSFYYRVQNATPPQDASAFYGKLLSDSGAAYEAWIAENLYLRASRSTVIQQAFTQWLSAQGYTPETIQDAGLVDIDGFVNSITWSPTKQRYLSSVEHAASADELVEGRGLELFLATMSTGYYPEEIWLNQIFPLFAGYWDQVVVYDRNNNGYLPLGDSAPPAPVAGTDNEQDALWQWISHQHAEGELIFDAEAQRWKLGSS